MSTSETSESSGDADDEDRPEFEGQPMFKGDFLGEYEGETDE